MKVRFRFSRRHNLYATLSALAFGLWLMVARFDLSVTLLLTYAAITVFLLIIILGFAAFLAWLLRRLSDKRQ